MSTQPRRRLPDLLPWRRRAAAGGRTEAEPRIAAPSELAPVSGVRSLPRPALRWVGPAGRTALREFDYASDADAVCGFQQETYTLNFPNFQYTANFAAAFRHDLRRASMDANHALFVLDAARVTGFIWLVICENSWTAERYGYVNNIFIEASQRGGGLGRELLTAGEEWFRQRGIRRARLTVTASNEAACHLYEQCGYGVARLELDKDL